MNLFPKIYKLCYRHKIYSLKSSIRAIHVSKLSSADEVSTKKDDTKTYDILEELREPELSEEEILRMRFKSRLPEQIYRKFVTKEPLPIETHYDFKMPRLRKYYARYGNESKLNPGICWPTRKEILEQIEYEKMFEPPLETRINNVQAARQAEENRKREVEADVEKNMAKLDQAIAEYNAKIEKKKQETVALKQKKEKLIDEISEYLGYEIDPRDPRFQEAVEQRDKEQKKEKKIKKQQESYDRMLSKLKQMTGK